VVARDADRVETGSPSPPASGEEASFPSLLHLRPEEARSRVARTSPSWCPARDGARDSPDRSGASNTLPGSLGSDRVRELSRTAGSREQLLAKFSGKIFELVF